MSFGAKKPEEEKKQQENLEIEDPIISSDIVEFDKDGPIHPLYGLHTLSRYYLYLQKYKGPVKYDLDHSAYHSKKEEILEFVNDEEMVDYWKLCIFSMCASK